MCKGTIKTRRITCELFSYKNYYPFIISLLFFVKEICFCYLCLGENNYETMWADNPLFFSLLLFFGELLNGVFYFISFCLIRTKHLQNSNNNETPNHVPSVRTILFKPKMNSSKGLIYCYFLLSAFMYAIVISTVNTLVINELGATDLSYQMMICSLFFISLFSRYILKYPIYRHQMFSFILVALGTLLGFISRVKETIAIENIFIYLGVYFILSIKEVLEKWLMESKQQRPIKIIFFEGLFGIIIMMIAMPIYPLIATEAQYFYQLIPSMFTDVRSSFLFVGYMFCCTFYTFFSIFTKYYFSPTVMPISYSLSIIYWRLFIMFQFETIDLYMYFIIPSYLILFIGSLIYNELLVLHCYGLDNNVKQVIMDRSLNDSMQALEMVVIDENEEIINDYD